LGDFTVTHNTTCARILTAALNCDRQDGNTCGVCDPCVRLATGRSTALVEMDAASNGLVADMRRIREEVQIATSDRYRVYVLDEAHSMSRQAWDACLKVLEEPPPGIVFVFCTTETEKIPATILSRAFSFTFQRIGIEAIVKRLDRIVTEQKIEISPEVVTAIAQQADGGMRDAISLLEQLMALSSGPIDSEAFDWAVGQVSFGKVLRIASALLARDIQTIFLSVESAANDVSDLAVLAGQLVDLFQLVVQIKTQTLPAGRLAADRLAAVTALSGQIGLDRIIETQSRLLALYEQTRRTRLSQQTILVAGLLRLLGPGLDPAPVAPATAPPPIVKAQSAQPFLSAAEVAAAFGGRIVER
jgi:DNA polymerase-3 subunit gamma/tau